MGLAHHTTMKEHTYASLLNARCRAWAILHDDEGATLVAIETANTADDMALVATADLGVMLSRNALDHTAIGLGDPNGDLNGPDGQANFMASLVLASYTAEGRFGLDVLVGLVDDVPGARWVALAKRLAGNGTLDFKHVLGSAIAD